MRVLTTIFVVATLALFSACSTDSQTDDKVEPTDTEADGVYFPPLDSDTWEKTSLQELDWNEEAEQNLYDFLEEKNTDAFIFLKDGKIVMEEYFGDFAQADAHAWHSAGKTLTAFTVGLAQQDGFLSLNDSSSDYLDSGWSNLSATDEAEITVKHHITMSTGLDYDVVNTNCTDPDCLSYLNEPGTFWYYHNAAYTLSQDIVAGAVNQDFETYFDERLKNRIGMTGTWVELGFNKGYYSNARSMARFGLLNLNKGVWNEEQIMTDSNYFSEMTTTSQTMNEAYGYLWWLNGKGSLRVPGSTLEFPGKLIDNAPNDLIAGLGKNDQKLYVVPSEGYVIVRMGDDTGDALLGPSSFDSELWQRINLLFE